MYAIKIDLPIQAGSASEYRIWLYDESVLLNAGGTVVTETANGFFEGSVTEDPDTNTLYRADVTEDGSLLGSGWLRPWISNRVNDPSASALVVGDPVIEDISDAVIAGMMDQFIAHLKLSRQYTSRAV